MSSSESIQAPIGTSKRWSAIRDPGFALRFERACLAHPGCPPLKQGRLAWIRAEFQNRFGEAVTTTTIAKWNIGGMKPRGARIDQLAEILGVDRNLLYFGSESDIQLHRRDRNALATGTVNIVAGLIQMDGGTIAFPHEDDSYAADDHVDLHAIIQGTGYALHIAQGEKVKPGWYRFDIPIRHHRVIVLGLVRDGLTFRLIRFSRAWIDQYRSRREEGTDIHLSAGDIVAMKIEDFSKRPFGG
jgi:hypothetical protein